jgi:hypothetical protein
MANHFLDGTLLSVALFKQPAIALDTPITGYRGETMYITAAVLDKTAKTLAVTIDDQGPPTALRFDPDSFTKATARVSLSGSPFSITRTPASSITYGGNPLVLTATLNLNATTLGKYDQTDLILAVSEWAADADPADAHPTLGVTVRGLEYIVVQHSNTKSGLNELRWFSTPIDTNPVKARGVQGPFGIETPSP